MMVRQQEGGRKARAKEMVSTIEEDLCVTPAFLTTPSLVRGIAGGGLLFAKGNDDGRRQETTTRLLRRR